MHSLCVVMSKEWKCFIRSDRGMFILHLVLILIWSILLSSKGTNGIDTGPLWLVFFSVVITANFSNTVFISERVSGALEILITSGVSRWAIFYGKMAFILLLSIVFGALCFVFSIMFSKLLYEDGVSPVNVSGFLLYVGSAFLNVSSSAYLSARMNNPRLLHFVNMLILAVIVGVYMLLSQLYGISIYLLVIFLCTISGLICWRGQISYNGEEILKPIYL